MSTGLASLQPTYHGHVATTRDALILFEACLSGQRHHVPRRPHDRERAQLIRSGCVFIYEENASGIKRWTDGVPWSPSRILGNFLVYRELLKPFPPGEKKRATKRAKRTAQPGEPYPRPSGSESGGGMSPASPPPPMPTAPSPSASTTTATASANNTIAPPTPTPTTTLSAAAIAGTPSSDQVATSAATSPFRVGDTYDREMERSLIGSLVDSYGFREGGLVKKTMSVHVNGVHHHLVSYYKVEDVLNRALKTPSQDELLRHIRPRPELTSRQNFRAPLDEFEEGGYDHPMEPGRDPYGYDDRRPPGPPHHHGYHHVAPHQQQASSHHGMPYAPHEHLPYATGPPPHLSAPSPYAMPGPPSHLSAPSPYGMPGPHPPQQHHHLSAPQSYGMPGPPPAPQVSQPSVTQSYQPAVTQSYYGPPMTTHPGVKTEQYTAYGPAAPYS
ncbi:MAG: hypothetical protein M1823_005509 [Watsoniomyces obsoletus]|nr:MAG: hypothetical protein M1823_005509 [Watsoniomyces obsoletus]